MLKRLALIPFGLLLAVLLLELGLQVAAFVAQATVRAAQPGAAGDGDVRVLCVGDSNTYGLYLDRSESYPAQLQALWNASHEAPKLEVLNLGMPGTNSSWLLRESDRLFETFRPDLVIVMAGANDFWTRPVPLEGVSEPWWSFLRHSKIYRALYMARRGREGRVLEVIDHREGPPRREPAPVDAPHRFRRGDFSVRYGAEEFARSVHPAERGFEGDQVGLRRNLQSLAERARARGIELLLMSYPSRQLFYGWASRTIRELAAELGVPFIDLEANFLTRCPEASCPALLFSDGHPKAAGYQRVAEAIVEWLSRNPRLRAD